jgi:RimJ/RimL family protein N-acetyltransferase
MKAHVAPTSFQLTRGVAADLPFIMATERLAGYEHLVGRWDSARHDAALADPRYAYFVARNGVEPVGFAIVENWASAERVAHIKRIAVCRPGIGHGKALLRLVMEVLFGETETYRLSLGLFPENLRARRAYESAGFRAEGISRGSAYFQGIHRDELIMSILRPEWAVIQSAS